MSVKSYIIYRPLMTEKMSRMEESQNKYGFAVHLDANKHEIKAAVEERFDVAVVKVATQNRKGKVKGMKMSAREGSITTTTPNFLVMLAPYLIPGYTVFIALLYFLLSFFVDVGKYSGIFIFFTGFTVMFHLAYTAESIKERQSDLVKTGYLLSVSFVYIANLLITFGIISFLFQNVSYLDFLSSVFESSKEFYCSFWRQLF